jgi:hypothetical protein
MDWFLKYKYRFGLWSLTPLSTLFQLYHGGYINTNTSCTPNKRKTTII